MRKESFFPYFQPIERLLAALCHLSDEHSSAPVIPSNTELQALNWEQLFSTALQHKLSPLLAQALQKQGPLILQLSAQWGSPSSKQYKELQRTAQVSWIQSSVRDHTLQSLKKSFDERQVPFLVFKGMSYIGTLYQDAAMRPMDDIDLIIEPGTQDAAKRALEAVGFKQVNVPHPSSFLYKHEEKKLYLDLHTSVSWSSMTNIPISELFTDATPTGLHQTLVPSRAHQLLLHIHHQGKEQLHAASIKLRTFIELKSLFLLQQKTWTEIRETAERWEMKRFLDCSLWCLDALYPEVVPKSFLNHSRVRKWSTRLVRQPCTYEEAQTFPKVAGRLFFLVANIDSWPNRVGYVQERLNYPIMFWQKQKKRFGRSFFSNSPN